MKNIFKIPFKHLQLVLVLALCCCRGNFSYSTNNWIKPIVLIDISNADPETIAKSIDFVTSCNASVIGINVVLDPLDESDSAIVSSINKSGKVVLPMAVVGDSVVGPDSNIVKNIRGKGIYSYAMKGNSIAGVQLYSTVNEGVIWSFPTVIFSEYDIERMDVIDDMTAQNVDYQCSFSFPMDSFKLASLDGITCANCNLFDNKIVLMGFLSPEINDTYEVIVGGKGKTTMYGTVIIANIVTDLINRYPVEIKKSWWERLGE